MGKLRNIVYLTDAEYETLVGGGTITKGGVTITYNENDLYLTPDSAELQTSSTITIMTSDGVTTANLNSTLVSTINKALVTPVSAPSETKLVAIDTNNEQTLINSSSKANADMTNVSYPANTAGQTTQGVADRVIETYISADGNTWYRKWSSGWKECGGVDNGTGSHDVTLPLTFSNTNYTAVVSFSALDATVISIAVTNKSQSTITVKKIFSSGFAGESANYYCCGF